MNRSEQLATTHHYNGFGGSARVQQQLVREISCLERQLERLRVRQDLLDAVTLQTYEDMIVSRQAMLEDLLRQN